MSVNTNKLDLEVNGAAYKPVPKPKTVTQQKAGSAFAFRKVDAATSTDQPLIRLNDLNAIFAFTTAEIDEADAKNFIDVKKKKKPEASGAGGSGSGSKPRGGGRGRGYGNNYGYRGNFNHHGFSSQRRASVSDMASLGRGKPETAAATAAGVSKVVFGNEKEKRALEVRDNPAAGLATACSPIASASGGVASNVQPRPYTAPDKSVAPSKPRGVRTNSDTAIPHHLLHSSSKESLGGSGRSSSVSVRFGGSSSGTSPSCTPRSGASPAAAGWGGARPMTPLALESAAGQQRIYAFRPVGNVLVSDEYTSAEQAELEAEMEAERKRFSSFAPKGKPQSVRSASDTRLPSLVVESPRTPLTPAWGTPRSGGQTPTGAAFLSRIWDSKPTATVADATAAGAAGNGQATVQADSKAAAAGIKEGDTKTAAAGKTNVVQLVFNKYAYGKVVTIDPQEARQINFSQRAVSCYTNDNQGIETIYGRFIDREEESVPPIEVVVTQNDNVVSYDNRRLFAYRLAQRQATDAKIQVIFHRYFDKKDKKYTWNDYLDYRLLNPFEPALGETENNPLPSAGVPFDEVCLRDRVLVPSGEVSTADWIWNNHAEK
jgi:hypothetical protein